MYSQFISPTNWPYLTNIANKICQIIIFRYETSVEHLYFHSIQNEKEVVLVLYLFNLIYCEMDYTMIQVFLDCIYQGFERMYRIECIPR